MRPEGRPMGLFKTAVAVAAASTWIQAVSASGILKTSGFQNCESNYDIEVQSVNIEYDNDQKIVTFDVSGSSSISQNVTAILNVTAYGSQVYSNTFDPCSDSTFVQQLCPVPVGNFSASGNQTIPSEYANLVPAIAFQVPDISAEATLQLVSKNDSTDVVACVEAQVTNGKTADVPAVSYIAVGIAGAALIMSGVSSLSTAVASGGAHTGGASTVSPSFTEVFGWFQGMAMNGMLSVNYPQVYRSFTKNFAFSTGVIPWTQMQVAIDNFRAATGGNLTNNSVESLRNVTLVFPDNSTVTPSAKAKRAVDAVVYRALAGKYDIRLDVRDLETTVNSTSSNSTESGAVTTLREAVTGIQAYVEQLSIPSSNTFMTVLLVVAIAIAAITVGVLLVKVILEAWALFGSFPESLAGFRKHYWRSLARAITTLILLLYGVWVLYCMYQFTHGDSWAAKTLAAVTLAIFTGILAFFSFQIWRTVRRLKDTEGDASGLYEDKRIWVKYSLFYEAYRKQYWWLFVPVILYMFAKGVALAVGEGHGMAQTISVLVIESFMMVLLMWSRPYERKSSNIINIVIQTVRVISVICILVFVEQFGIAETTQTVAGVVLIAVQAALTGILAILIAWNAIIACCKENPHRRRRKQMEKERNHDTLTPLDARNSLLLPTIAKSTKSSSSFSLHDIAIPTTKPGELKNSISLSSLSSSTLTQPRMPPSRMLSSVNNTAAATPPLGAGLAAGATDARPLTPTTPIGGHSGKDSLLLNVAPISRDDGAGRPSFDTRQPTMQSMGYDATGTWNYHDGAGNNGKKSNNARNIANNNGNYHRTRPYSPGPRQQFGRGDGRYGGSNQGYNQGNNNNSSNSYGNNYANGYGSNSRRYDNSSNYNSYGGGYRGNPRGGY